MTTESAFIAMMRGIATNAAARELKDDAAVLEIGQEAIVVTHDMMVEGVHWLPSADPADVAWKLVAVNLSDLAAKGAKPLGVLLGFMLGEDEWDRRFASGLMDVLDSYNVALLGGDTVSSNRGVRSLGLTALGVATHLPVPARSSAVAGNIIYVTGTLGNALAGFEFAEAGLDAPVLLRDAYHRPIPLIETGQSLAPIVTAMMDISDGLLLDASRMAAASGVCFTIDLAAIPLSDPYKSVRGTTRDSRLQAAIWGDDYQLLFTTAKDTPLPISATAIGYVTPGSGLKLTEVGVPIPLPSSLGYEHR
jgi:thiamine-monophosphate kinase